MQPRTECFSLILRLHHADILQGSFYVRNIMIQPGPLTAPPAERSFETPSFRIIDYGRGTSWDWELEEAEAAETASVSKRSSSVSSGELGVVRHASLVRREAEEGQQGRLIRVKSVGAVSARSVSASRRIAFSRDSIKVELGHIARQGGMEVESDGSVGAAM